MGEHGGRPGTVARRKMPPDVGATFRRSALQTRLRQRRGGTELTHSSRDKCEDVPEGMPRDDGTIRCQITHLVRRRGIAADGTAGGPPTNGTTRENRSACRFGYVGRWLSSSEVVSTVCGHIEVARTHSPRCTRDIALVSAAAPRKPSLPATARRTPHRLGERLPTGRCRC